MKKSYGVENQNMVARILWHWLLKRHNTMYSYYWSVEKNLNRQYIYDFFFPSLFLLAVSKNVTGFARAASAVNCMKQSGLWSRKNVMIKVVLDHIHYPKK